VLGILSIYLNMLTQQNRAYTVRSGHRVGARAILDAGARRARDRHGGGGRHRLRRGQHQRPRCCSSPTAASIRPEKEPRALRPGAEVQASASSRPAQHTFALNTLVPDGVPYHDLDADGTQDSDFRPGGGVIVAERFNPTRGVACGVIVAGGVDVGNKTLTVNFDAGAENPALGSASEVFPAKRYTVNGDDELVRNGVVLAGDVGDLQVSPTSSTPRRRRRRDSACSRSPARDGTSTRSTTGTTRAAEIRLGIVVRSRTTRTCPARSPGAREPPAGGRGRRLPPRVLQAVMRPRNVGHRLDADIF
jgi:hypothetical protein